MQYSSNVPKRVGIWRKRGRLSLNRIFLELGACRQDVYRRGTIKGYHGRIPGTCDNTTIYSNTDKEELLQRLRELYIKKAIQYQPRLKDDDDSSMKEINVLYDKGKHIIEKHYEGI